VKGTRGAHSLTLVRDSLGQERLSGTGRTVEEDTLGGRHAVLEELLWVFDGVLDGLLKLLLDLFETSDVLPLDVRDLDDGLSKGGRVRDTEGESEVLHGDTERVEDFGVDGVSAHSNKTKCRDQFRIESEGKGREETTYSSRSMRSIFSRICCIAASEQSEAMSAPT
jgi:hypothetical protein